LEKINLPGHHQRPAQVSSLRREFLTFLAGGPPPAEIISFRPSSATVQRMRDLLQQDRQGGLSAAEEAEMEGIAEIDHLVTQVKAQARLHLRASDGL
jgi:hypothetical protein